MKTPARAPGKPAEYRSRKDWPHHISCGGVVYCVENEERRYALLVRYGQGDEPTTWHLPKGTLATHETLETAALREISEETGLEAEVEAYLGAIQGAFAHPRNGRWIDKVTLYFLCRWTGAVSPMDDEHDALEWHGAEAAVERLSGEPKQEEEIVRRAEAWFQRGG